MHKFIGLLFFSFWSISSLFAQQKDAPETSKEDRKNFIKNFEEQKETLEEHTEELDSTRIKLIQEQIAILNRLKEIKKALNEIDTDLKRTENKTNTISKQLRMLYMISEENDYLITIKNDTIWGKIMIDINANPYIVHEHILFLKEGDLEPIDYYPNEINGYYNNDGEHYASIFIDNKYHFLRLLVPGYAKLYLYNRSMSGGGNKAELYLRKGTYRPMKVKELTFHKTVHKFFYETKEIREKIVSKEYKIQDLEMLVEMYNDYIGSISEEE